MVAVGARFYVEAIVVPPQKQIIQSRFLDAEAVMTKEKQQREAERRELENGPPSGWKERRRSVERRLPEVQLEDMSEEQFFAELLAVKQRLMSRKAPDGEPTTSDQG